MFFRAAGGLISHPPPSCLYRPQSSQRGTASSCRPDARRTSTGPIRTASNGRPYPASTAHPFRARSSPRLRSRGRVHLASPISVPSPARFLREEGRRALKNARDEAEPREEVGNEGGAQRERRDSQESRRAIPRQRRHVCSLSALPSKTDAGRFVRGP